MTEQVTSKRTYLLIGLILLALTLTTYLVAYVDLGPWNTVVALTIAAAKASLIILFFMNARFSRGITRVAIGAGLLWLGLLIVGTLDDFVTRGWLGIPGK
jgi:cytochrome c oxidase subunit IV